jgi:hypothetical protein
MQPFLWILADVVKYSAYVATAIYAPFAKTWARALVVPFILVFAWGVVREVSIVRFREDTPPGMYFLMLPFLYLVYASVMRGLKLLLFRLPVLKAFEQKIRSRFTRTL